MRVKLIAGLSGLVLITVLIAAPAAAAKPVVNQGEFQDTYVNPGCGFDVTVQEAGRFRETVRFDSDGPVSRQFHIQGTTVVTSEWGEAFDRWAWNGKIDLATGINPEMGNHWNVHAGAGGVLVNDSGRIVFDRSTGEVISISGPHQAFEGDFGDLCAALGPPGA